MLIIYLIPVYSFSQSSFSIRVKVVTDPIFEGKCAIEDFNVKKRYNLNEYYDLDIDNNTSLTFTFENSEYLGLTEIFYKSRDFTKDDNIVIIKLIKKDEFMFDYHHSEYYKSGVVGNFINTLY